jgi:succinate dehydrogenase / fumarate reductase cytochrome b subunit
VEDHASSAAQLDSRPFLVRHDFLLRRLHSLTGLIPVGAYMVVHLLTNASVLNGPETFQNQVNAIHSLGKALPIVEWTFIFIPILFHAIFGVIIIRTGKSNTSSYPLGKNIRYTLQRATGMIAFAYIAWHVLHLHWMGRPFGGGKFEHEFATSSAAGAIQAALWIQALYAVGVLACVFHLANGLWTMGITWGAWTTPRAQRRADYVCIAFGVGLAVVGLSALFGMSTVDIADARAMEQVQHEMRQEQRQRIEQLRQQQSAEVARQASEQASGQ